MAQFNEILEGHLQQLLTRRLGMQGGSPAPVLAPEIIPCLVLESDRPEWSFLKDERLWGFGAAVPADAGSRTAVRIHNASTSNALTVIEEIWITPESTSTFTVQVHTTATALGTARSAMIRDTRNPFDVLAGTAALPVSISSGSLAAAAGTELFRCRTLASQLVQLRSPIVLSPGWTIDIQTAAVNIASNIAVTGRIRAAVPGELLG